jgi:ABC-type branched-subunit amino acid transport system permease subunit
MSFGSSCILYDQHYQAFCRTNWTFYPIFMVPLVGIRALKGPILGSIIFMGLYYVITLYLTELSLIIFGLLLVVIAVFLPEGISSKITFKMREKKGSGS